MDLQTIDMPKTEARQRFEEYRRAVRDSRDKEDRAIAAGYKAIAQGTPVIRLSETMIAGGTTRKKVRGGELRTVPQLAVCRADKPFAWTSGVSRDGSLTIAGKRTHHTSNRRDVLTLSAGSFELLEGTSAGWGHGWGWGYALNAMAPVIPPPMRPSISLSNFFLLWEAEWKMAPGPPPGDPALLKPIGGDLYAVHAVWDLTPLEQAVLSGRPLPEA